jgi:hypothetical protein
MSVHFSHQATAVAEVAWPIQLLAHLPTYKPTDRAPHSRYTVAPRLTCGSDLGQTTDTMAYPHFVAIVMMASSLFAQQQAANRFIHVSVTDEKNRFVTGMTNADFSVRENGMVRPAAFFASPDDEITVAVVAPGISMSSIGEAHVVTSISDALQLLGSRPCNMEDWAVLLQN